MKAGQRNITNFTRARLHQHEKAAADPCASVYNTAFLRAAMRPARTAGGERAYARAPRYMNVALQTPF